jgi:hypothetical protein
MADIKDFFRGDTKKYTFRLRDKRTGKPISVHKGVLTFTLKRRKDDPDSEAVLQKSVVGKEYDTRNPEGIITLVLTNDETSVPPGTYYYDFQFVSCTGEVTTILPGQIDSGKVKIKQDVTRSANTPSCAQTQIVTTAVSYSILRKMIVEVSYEILA